MFILKLALLRCRLRLGGQVAHYDVHNISTLATLLRLTDASDQIHFSEYVCYLLKIIEKKSPLEQKMLDLSQCLTCTTRELRLVRFAQLCQFLRIQYLFNPFNRVRKAANQSCRHKMCISFGRTLGRKLELQICR